ncbi:hypothetical protein GC175_14410 [bacterium]|nr:hypothetical protein [bacterium]
MAENTFSALDEVTAAWQRAQESGSYHFSSDVIQVTIPEATLTNVGRRSIQEQVYLEGETDLRAGSMQIKLWTDSLDQGGSVLVPESGLEVTVADGKTRTRRGNGPWEESTGFTHGYAPQGDFLAYLAAMRDVHLLGTETKHGLTYTRYAFTIDGPSFAAYSRDQMQKAMRQRGDLPPNVQLEVSPYNAQMTGDGELWVGEDGLPLRQILNLRFPPQNQESVSAQIAVNFFDYGQPAPSPLAALMRPQMLGPMLTSFLATTLLLAVIVVGALTLVFFRRKTLVQAGVAVSMSVILVVMPLLTNLPTLRFLDRQTAHAAALETTNAEVDVARSLRTISSESTFDPRANPMDKLTTNVAGPLAAPLAAAHAVEDVSNPKCLSPGAATDPDGDGLTTAEELAVGTDPNVADSDGDALSDCEEVKIRFTNPMHSDTDGDGLSDFQEIGLGTDPRNEDTDNDGLNDKAEIEGFTDPHGVKWFTDPVQPDSNSDGINDFLERGPIENGADKAIDSDGDGTPDLYDTDNDNDGIPDGADLSPFAAGSAYGPNVPLQITINGLESGRGSVLELQLRPVMTDHLRYAYTVLDWPADRKGQVQDWDNATFAQNLVNRNEIATTANAPANDGYGDMRLTPNLEITIDGSDGSDLSLYHLPSQAALAPYNINVITSTHDGTATGTPTGIKLYVPLSLVTDPRTGSRVAFSARIPYTGTGTAWTTAHQVRMVWTVQMLMDLPCDPTDTKSIAAGCVTFDGSPTERFALAETHKATLDAETASDALRAAFTTGGYTLKDPVTVNAFTPGSHWQVTDKNGSYTLRLKTGLIQVYATIPGVIYNRSQVIQRYEDDWRLTGANLTEDHGVNVGIIYEDPAPGVDPDLNSDDALWALAFGLEESFLNPSDANLDSRPDVTVNDLYRRFNRATNGDVPAQERWNIDNVLTVKQHHYDSVDWAVASVAMTETAQTLKAFDAAFVAAFAAQGPITPTLLYVQEMTYRAVGMDDMRTGGVYMNLAGNALSVNLAPAAKPVLQPTSVYSAKWTAFCAEPGSNLNPAPTWAACDQVEYVSELARRYRTALETTFPAESETQIDGRVIMINLYYASLRSGVSVTAQTDGQVIIERPRLSDTELAQTLGLAKGAKAAGTKVADIIIKSSFTDVDALLKTIGQSDFFPLAGRSPDAAKAINKITHSGKIQEAFTGIDANGVKGGMIRAKAIVSIAAVAFGVLAQFIWPDSQIAQVASAAVTVGILNIYLGFLKPLQSAKALASVTSWGAVLKGNAALVNASAKATAIGTAIAIVAAWGFFLATVSEWSGPAFNAALAGVLALTLYLVFLAVLSSTVVGLLLVALLAVIDGLLSLICAASGDAKDALGDKDGDCTVGTKIVTALAGYLYARDMIIELDAEKNPKLVDQGSPIVELRNPGRGYIAGNAITFTVPVTTNIVHKNPDNWNVMFDIPYFYNQSNFRDTTFRYTLSLEKAAFEVNLDEMSNQWNIVSAVPTTDYGIPWVKRTATAYQEPALTNLFLGAGINRPIDYWFNMAYALPAYECWTVIYIPVCELQTERGGDPSFVNGPSYDIFPDTVGEFFATANSAGGGQRLAWDTNFPTIWDADGDGLVTAALGGIDPDDTKPDADFDGLSDRFELEQRMAGVRLAADQWDTDGDGLTDAQEVQYGTNPANADTDNDGLRDGEEVYHQVFYRSNETMLPALDANGKPVFTGGWEVCAPAHGLFPERCMWVSSDPKQADADGDGIPDDAEKRLYERYKLDRNGQPYHPSVANVNPLQLTISANVAEDGYLRPGTSFVYTNSVIGYVDLDPVVLEIERPVAVGGGVDVTPLGLSLNSPATIVRNYQIDPSAGSQSLRINSSARARTKAVNVNATFQISPTGTNYLSGFSNPPSARALSAAVRRPDLPDAYLLNGLATANPGRGSTGDIWSYIIGGGSGRLDQDDYAPNTDIVYRRSAASPRVACTASGKCMSVWDQVQNCLSLRMDSLYVNDIGDDHDTNEIEPFVVMADGYATTGIGTNWSPIWDWADYNTGGMGNGAYATTGNGLPYTKVFCDSPNVTESIAVYEADGTVYADYSERIGVNLPLSVNWRYFGNTETVTVNPGLSDKGDNDNDADITLTYTLIGRQRNIISGATMQPTVNGLSLGKGNEFNLMATNTDPRTGDFNPVIASNGSTFTVAWNRKVVTPGAYPLWNIRSSLMTQQYQSNGVLMGSPVEHWVRDFSVDATPDLANGTFYTWDNAFARSETDIITNLIWAGDRYRLAWTVPVAPATATTALLYRDLFANSVGTTGVVVGSLPKYQYNRLHLPSLDYDPINKKIMTVYHSTGDKVAGVLSDLVAGTDGQIAELASKSTGGQPKPAIAYHPGIPGWLLSFDYQAAPNHAMSYALLNPDGSALGNPTLDANWPKDNTLLDAGRTLICPAPSTAPVTAFAFEELPSMTTFADASGHGVTATCTGEACPLVGVAGVGILNQPRAAGAVPPRTDRSLYFDGVDDLVSFTAPVTGDFTYSFWFKPDSAKTNSGTSWNAGSPLLLAYGGNSFANYYGISIGAENRIYAGVGGKTATSQPVALDTWHHVAFTYDTRIFAFSLYVDGQPAGFGLDPLPVDTPTVALGWYNDLHYRGSIDYLNVFDTALQSDAIARMYVGELTADLGYTANPSYCIVAGATDSVSGFAWDKLYVHRMLPRGTGPLSAQDGLSLRVDAVPPTSTIDSFASGEYIQAPPTGRAGLALGTINIGGSAGDTDSGVHHVDVLVNGVPYSATGQATWTYVLAYGAEGTYTLQSRAVDNVDYVEVPRAAILLHADGTPPDPYILTEQAVPARGTNGRWTFTVDGQASDPALNNGQGTPGSGVDPAGLRLFINAEDGTPLIEQPVTLSGVNWTTTVELPSAIGDPSGVYSMTVRAVDNVGNSADFVTSLRLDVSTAEVAIDADSAVTDYITGAAARSAARSTAAAMSLSGVISNSMGIGAVEGAFLSITQTTALSGTVMILNLDEPNGEVWFEDATLNQNAAYCVPSLIGPGDPGPFVAGRSARAAATCPSSAALGRVNNGVYFDGATLLQVADDPSLDFDVETGFTVQAWIKTTATDVTILSKYAPPIVPLGAARADAAGQGYALAINPSGMVIWQLNGVDVVTANKIPVNDNEWHHIAGVVRRSNGEAVLYVDGFDVGYSGLDESVENNAGFDIGGVNGVFSRRFVGFIDGVMVSRRDLGQDEINIVKNMADLAWLPAVFTKTSGGLTTDDPVVGTWSLPVPANLEGFYQLDLRTTDGMGRIFRRGNQWRGVIDNLAPRITVQAGATGVLYLDPVTGAPRYDIEITDVTAADLHLDRAGFVTSCGNGVQPTPDYIDAAWKENFFPGITLRNQLTVQCHFWATEANPSVDVTACDSFGQCTTVNQPVSTAAVARSVDATTLPVLIWPPAGSVIAITDTIQIQMSASSAGALKEMGVLVDGNAAEMVSFAQSANVTQTVATVTFALPAAGENVYGLSVRTTAWDGTVLEGPVNTVTLDTGDPQGNLITDVLTEDADYSPAGGIMRFSGSAGDSMGNANVAAVEISVDGGPFQDVTWDGKGGWSAAVYVGPNPYGKILPVTMRTTDKAGRVTTDTKNVLVDVPAPDGFDAAAIPSLSIADVTVNEGAGTAQVTIRLSAARVVGTVSVQYSTADGSAVAAADYDATSGNAVIRAGETSVTVSVPIKDNGEVEAPQRFFVNLAGAVNATLADGQGIVTIADNDGGPTPTVTPIPGATATSTPAATVTPVPSATSTPTIMPTVMPTVTATPTATKTPIASATPTPTATAIPPAGQQSLYLPFVSRLSTAATKEQVEADHRLYLPSVARE